jgi:hypothetical protein
MSLRNELRQPLTNLTLYESSYNWRDWYTYSQQAAQAIHSSNPDVLIFLSGIDSDTDLSAVVQGTALTPSTASFSFDDFPGYANKLVLELHNYANILGGISNSNCSSLESDLLQDGFETLGGSAPNEFPIVMSEFGFVQDATTWNGTFASCLEKYLAAEEAGWMIWPLSGSYYIRENVTDVDESWGLLVHDWSDWRSPEHISGGLIPLVNATLSVKASNATGDTTGGQDGGSSSNGTAKSLSARNAHVYGAGHAETVTIISSLVAFVVAVVLFT